MKGDQLHLLMKINDTSLEVVRGSVVTQTVAAIVNAANTAMRGGGGIDGAIHMVAGPNLLDDLRRVAPRGAETAEVIATPAFLLPQHWIFHVAGPIYHRYAPEEAARLLALSYRNCLAEADARGLESLAFPSLSTGAYGYPIEEAAPLALETACKYLQRTPDTSLKRIVFAMFGASEFAVFGRELGHLQARLEESR